LESDLIKPNATIPLIQESVVDFWESVPRDWPKHKYDVALVEDLDKLLREYGQKQGFPIKRVLDCGCGTGNPSIGLAKKGYEMFCVDSDPNMIERFKNNCQEARVEIPVITYDWRDLNGDLQRHGPFDAAICRGNSLIYAGCWERHSFVPQVAAKAIASSLKHIANVVRPGGLFYVDITSAKEYADSNPKVEFVGVRETETHKIVVYWFNEYFPDTRTRRVQGRRIFESKKAHCPEVVKTYTFTGYMLYHSELLELAKSMGWVRVLPDYSISAEWLYDVFLFSKKPELMG
jgi:SAM-dependent methyltransferase